MTMRYYVAIDNGGSGIRASLPCLQGANNFISDNLCKLVEGQEIRDRDLVDKTSLVSINSKHVKGLSGTFVLGEQSLAYTGVETFFKYDEGKSMNANYYRLLLMGIAGVLYANDASNGNVDIDLTTMLPVREYSRAVNPGPDVVRKTLIGHSFVVSYPLLKKEYNITFSNIGILPEGTATASLATNVKINKGDITVCTDLGHVSFDVSILVGKSSVIDRACRTSGYAGSYLIDSIISALEDNGIAANYSSVVNAINSSGFIREGNANHDARNIIYPVIDLYIKNVMAKDVALALEAAHIKPSQVSYLLPVGALLGNRGFLDSVHRGLGLANAVVIMKTGGVANARFDNLAAIEKVITMQSNVREGVGRSSRW